MVLFVIDVNEVVTSVESRDERPRRTQFTQLHIIEHRIKWVLQVQTIGILSVVINDVTDVMSLLVRSTTVVDVLDCLPRFRNLRNSFGARNQGARSEAWLD